MSPDRRALLEAKGAVLLENADLLRIKLAVPRERYLASRDLQLQVERLCQIVIECAIDMTAATVEAAGKAPPASAREGFETLAILRPAAKVLCDRFAWRYTGFRNRLVHEYERLDQQIVFGTARGLVGDARKLLSILLPGGGPPPSRPAKNGPRRKT